MTFSSILIVAGIVVLYLANSIKILPEYERGVIFRLGKLLPQPKGRASSWCSRRSTRWCVWGSGRSSWTCRHRTSSLATTSR